MFRRLSRRRALSNRSIKRSSARLRHDRRVKKVYGAARNSPVKDLIDQTDREFFASFAKRPGMYIGYTDLRGVVTYIEGYDMAPRWEELQ